MLLSCRLGRDDMLERWKYEIFTSSSWWLFDPVRSGSGFRSDSMEAICCALFFSS